MTSFCIFIDIGYKNTEGILKTDKIELNKFHASKKDPFYKCLFFLIIMLVKYASFLKQLRITLIILTLKNYHLGINLFGF